jgi:curli production assembly/transport component CsgG
LLSVTTSKTIFSHELTAGAFRFIDYKDLLEVEMGYTNNEPVNVAVMSAIDAAVIHLIVKGIGRGLWKPENEADLQDETIQRYAKQTHQIL